MKTIYLCAPKMKWPTFKTLQKKLVKDSGPTPVHGDRMLWQLMKERKIYCWFDNDLPDDMAIGTHLPKKCLIKTMI